MQHSFRYNLHSFPQCQLITLNLGPIYNIRPICSHILWQPLAAKLQSRPRILVRECEGESARARVRMRGRNARVRRR